MGVLAAIHLLSREPPENELSLITVLSTAPLQLYYPIAIESPDRISIPENIDLIKYSRYIRGTYKLFADR